MVPTCTRSGLLQERLLPLGGGGGGGGGNSASEASSGRWVARSVSASSLAPYSSSSSVLLHFDMEELHDTDLVNKESLNGYYQAVLDPLTSADKGSYRKYSKLKQQLLNYIKRISICGRCPDLLF